MRQFAAQTALLLAYVFLVQCFLKRVYTDGGVLGFVMMSHWLDVWLVLHIEPARCEEDA